MIDLASTYLSDEERKRLAHPLVGGVVLFTRNYSDRGQLTALTSQIHELRSPPLLIGVDHEGGRVQRFRPGFTRLPPMAELGRLDSHDAQLAINLAEHAGYVLAGELLASGVDLSFTPVLDLDYGHSTVIGDRALHSEPEVVVSLASALCRGLFAAGMSACGKHFPGHGWVVADSHTEIPVDERTLDELNNDIYPFKALAHAGALQAVMPAHVIYPQVDAQPAGFSRCWLNYLRQKAGFDGVIFSDDLSMAGAAAVGDISKRADAALNAGCDMLLICNAPNDAEHLLATWQPPAFWGSDNRARLATLQPRRNLPDWVSLSTNPSYLAAMDALGTLDHLALEPARSSENQDD